MQFEQTANCTIIDPRAKMAGLILFCLLSFFLHTVPVLLAYLSIPIIFLIFLKPSGRFFTKMEIGAGLFLSACILLYFWARAQCPIHLDGIASARAIVRVFIFTGSGLIFMLTTSSSRFILGLEKLHLPPPLIFVLAIAIRFFPHLLQEMELISNNLQGRGIGFYQWLRHPVYSGRAFIFPVVIRAIKKADTLAMAATMRGFGAPIPRTCRQKLTISTPDYLFLISLLIIGLIFFYCDRYAYLKWGM